MKFVGIGFLLAFVVGQAPNRTCAKPILPDAYHSPSSHQDQPKREKSLATFFGTIVKDGDKFVLNDAKRKIWYELDDQQTVAKFEGKTVKVTGTLDVAKNLILVQSIEQASN